MDYGGIVMKICTCKVIDILQNTHSNKKNIELMIISDKDDCGLVMFENNDAIATFDCEYCPKCGGKLEERI